MSDATLQKSNFGNLTCSRCHALETELNNLKKEVEELKLKHNKETQALENQGKKRQAKLKKTNQGLEQKIGNLTTEKNKIDNDNKRMEKELENTKDVLVDNKRLLEEAECTKEFFKREQNRCNQLCTEIKRLRKEYVTSHSKCEELDKELKKYKGAVMRKY